jgi:hypothetical protein
MSNKLNRYEQYDHSISNGEILLIEEQIQVLEYQLKKHNERIREIQNECDHHFQFLTSGTYSDYYKCNKCGLEREQ